MEPSELITAVDLPPLSFSTRSTYVKVRDRASYAFALASAAVALDIDDGTIREARIALGGVATKPWRARDAERLLVGRRPEPSAYRAAADLALAGAVPRAHNSFKIELAKRTLVRALSRVGAMA
jgi:xanthine dehydrogenase YagS FAD-binding subunit